MDDDSLVREFQSTADPAHFNALVERHQGPVFRLVLSVLGPGRAGEAEELTQDVFVKVYQRLGQFRGEAQFRTWLYRIAYNAALDHRSRLSFKATHQSEEVLTMTPSQSRESNPFQLTVDAAQRSAIRQAMDRLPALYRSALHLHYWMGMTVAEVGEALEVPEGTVKSYLYRARAKLHTMLSKQGVTDV